MDSDLCEVLTHYLSLCIEKAGKLMKPTSPLFIAQKGGPYSPNTLQEIMFQQMQNLTRFGVKFQGFL